MRTVIVPLDGSVDAEIALPHARALAGTDGRLLLLTSVWNGEPVSPRRYMEDRALELAAGPAKVRVALDERPSTAILQLAAQHPQAEVCMATHGRNGLGQAVLGSTAEVVLRGTDRPIVLVGPHAAYEPARAAAHNVVLAVDDPGSAEALVPAAADFADRHHQHLWTIQAVAPAPYPVVADAAVPSRLGEASGVAPTVELLSARALGTETKTLVAMDPAGAIVGFAHDLPASYLAVGSHGRRGVARIALRSVAMRIVHDAPCPVLVTRR
jgi:nucleotide-binding universal stress UspA family protein